MPNLFIRAAQAQALTSGPASKEVGTVQAIDALVGATGPYLVDVYTKVLKLVNENPRFATRNKDGTTTYDATAIYAAFQAYTKLVVKDANGVERRLTAQDLGNFAKVVKAVIELFQPGTLNDSVPMATITLP